MTGEDARRILGLVDVTLSSQAIKKAWRQRVGVLHTDRIGGKSAVLDERMRELADARALLLRLLEEPIAPPLRESPGVDEQGDMTVPFLLALQGGSTTLRIPRVGGEEAVEVDVPAGVVVGQRLRVAGRGGAGHPRGDLYLTVLEVVAHPLWRHTTELTRSGLDLETTIKTSYGALYTERIIPVRTPWDTGTTPLQLRANDFGPYRIRGHGARRGAGDLVVHLEVLWPRPGNAELGQLLLRLG